MFLDELSRILRLKVPADRVITLAQRETEKIVAAEEILETKRLLTLHERFVGAEEEGLEKYVEDLSDEETIKLDIARKNKPIYERPFRSLNIIKITPATDGTPAEAYIRFGSVASRRYKVRKGSISGKFKQILFTNTAQPGASITYITSQDPNTRFNMPEDESVVVSTLPHIHKVDMANANGEYSQVLPPGTTYMKAHLADNTLFRFAFKAGQVATPTELYITQPADIPFVLGGIRFDNVTFYFASPEAGKKMCMLVLQ